MLLTEEALVHCSGHFDWGREGRGCIFWRRLGILRRRLWIHALYGMWCFRIRERDGWIWSFYGAVVFLW